MYYQFSLLFKRKLGSSRKRGKQHYGDWAVAKLKEHAGVIRLKVHPTSSSMIKDTLFPFFEQNSDREFYIILAIVKESGIRWIRTA